MVSRWARTGQLRVDGKRATPGDRIAAGQVLRVPPQGDEPAPAAKPQRKREMLTADEVEFVRGLVIHEDAAAIVVNKPPGLATQGGTKTNDHLDRLLDGLVEEGAAAAETGPPARQGHVGGACSSPRPRAPPLISRRAFPGAPRARSIGRW